MVDAVPARARRRGTGGVVDRGRHSVRRADGGHASVVQHRRRDGEDFVWRHCGHLADGVVAVAVGAEAAAAQRERIATHVRRDGRLRCGPRQRAAILYAQNWWRAWREHKTFPNVQRVMGDKPARHRWRDRGALKIALKKPLIAFLSNGARSRNGCSKSRKCRDKKVFYGVNMVYRALTWVRKRWKRFRKRAERRDAP